MNAVNELSFHAGIQVQAAYEKALQCKQRGDEPGAADWLNIATYFYMAAHKLAKQIEARHETR